MDEIRLASPTRSAKWSTHAARQMLWLALVLALPGGAQNAPSGIQQPSPWQQMPISPAQQSHSSGAQMDNVDPVQQERWQRGLNAERQKLMVSDANKLLKLAGELNAEIRSSNSDSFTPEQLRKVGEIEKLAHSVKEKMSNPVQNTPLFAPPASPRMR